MLFHPDLMVPPHLLGVYQGKSCLLSLPPEHGDKRALRPPACRARTSCGIGGFPKGLVGSTVRLHRGKSVSDLPGEIQFICLWLRGSAGDVTGGPRGPDRVSSQQCVI